jgi:hypothetical protein
MKHIEELLSSLKELRPIETDLAPKYNRDTDIKAVVLIYTERCWCLPPGTLTRQLFPKTI